MDEKNVKREGWEAGMLGEQSAYEGTTEIKRRLRRGDETVGDPDARDVAGAAHSDELPHARDGQDTPHPEGPAAVVPSVAGRDAPNPGAPVAGQRARQQDTEPRGEEAADISDDRE